MRVVEGQNHRPARKGLRLADFNYSTPGSYFVTICVLNRRCLLGDVCEDRVVLSAVGQIVSDIWLQTPRRHQGVALDEFVIMPNHVHALLALATKPTSLSAVIGAFKSVSSNAAHKAGMLTEAKLWQRGFHDHVVRGEASLGRLREYIVNNPLKWHLDRENPTNYQAKRSQP